MQLMKELWDASGFGHLDLTSQNLRDQAAWLEKSMGDVRIVMAESVGLRVEEEHAEESERREVNNVCNLDPNNFVVNHKDADLHTIADEASPAGPVIVLSQETHELIGVKRRTEKSQRKEIEIVLSWKRKCKGLSVLKLVSYMEKQIATLRKLKRGFPRSQKQEVRVLNQQFQVDASRVYSNMRKLLNRDKENDRPRYTTYVQADQGGREN